MRARWKGPYFSSSTLCEKSPSRLMNSNFFIPNFLDRERILVYTGRRFETFSVKAFWPQLKVRFSDFTTFKKSGRIHKKIEKKISKKKIIKKLWDNQLIL